MKKQILFSDSNNEVLKIPDATPREIKLVNDFVAELIGARPRLTKGEKEFLRTLNFDCIKILDFYLMGYYYKNDELTLFMEYDLRRSPYSFLLVEPEEMYSKWDLGIYEHSIDEFLAEDNIVGILCPDRETSRQLEKYIDTAFDWELDNMEMGVIVYNDGYWDFVSQQLPHIIYQSWHCNSVDFDLKLDREIYWNTIN